MLEGLVDIMCWVFHYIILSLWLELFIRFLCFLPYTSLDMCANLGCLIVPLKGKGYKNFCMFLNHLVKLQLSL